MEQLKLWKNADNDRSYGFVYSRSKTNNAWMCTLTVHNGCNSYSYTGITNLFVGTKYNTRKRAKKMAIFLFSSDTKVFSSLSTQQDISHRKSRFGVYKPSFLGKSMDEVLNKPLVESEEDSGLDDVTIIKRTFSEEKRFIKQLDDELEEYMKNYPSFY